MEDEGDRARPQARDQVERLRLDPDEVDRVVRVRVRTIKDVIVDLEAEGHSEHAAPPHDIVCAAVTALIKATALTYKAVIRLGADGGAPREGVMWFRTKDWVNEAIEGTPENDLPGETHRLRGASDVLLKGLNDIEQLHPENLVVDVETVASVR